MILMQPSLILLPGGLGLVLGAVLPLAVLPLLRRLGVLDMPGERSSHAVPTLRGMGLATAAAALLGALAGLVLGLVPVDRSVMLVVLTGMVACGVLGWREDSAGVSVRVRAAAQLLIGLAVTLGLTLVLGTGYWWIPVGVLAVAGYINVANFMDGINGISGLHGLTAGVFYAYAGWVTDHPWLVVAASAIAGAYLAFLPWNLWGSRVFLGDTGSYFLGGSLACCAVGAFLSGVYVEYLLGPLLVYLADTGTTLLRRIRRGEPWYRPHRQHVYQRLTDLGLSHLGSAAVVTAATAAVSALSIWSLDLSRPAAAATGAGAVAILGLYLSLPTLLTRLRPARARGESA